jgi:hypothetical protein
MHMADQLLSQVDVDALVASISKNNMLKAAAPTATAQKPGGAAVPGSKMGKKVPSVGVPNGTNKNNTPAHPESKPDMSADTINSLSLKIADLTKQLGQVNAAIKRLEILERKINDMDIKISRNAESPITTRKIQILGEELHKISTKLKGTPGYGVRNNFTCEECSDEGHVAIQYRCTKCGHERWYGWWPEK